MTAENFAILFSGGGDLEINFPRYYRSTLNTYNALVSRGVDPSNIAIAFGPGYDSDGIAKEIDLNFNDTIVNSIADQSLDPELEFALSTKQFSELLSFFEDVGAVEEKSSGDLVYYDGTWHIESSYFNSSFLPKFNYLKQKIEEDDLFMFKEKYGYSTKDPTKINFDIDFSSRSNFSQPLKEGAILLSGTEESLEEIVDSFNSQVGSDDALFVWTFDHGGIGDVERVSNTRGTYQTIYSDQNMADLTPWNEPGITAREFANIFEDIVLNTYSSTFALAQCFSGGLVRAMFDNQKYINSNNWIAFAATNQHELSWASSFADGISSGLMADTLTGQELFEFAKDNDNYAAKGSYLPNSYTDEIFVEGNRIEHPWSSFDLNGIDRPLFVGGDFNSETNQKSKQVFNQQDFPYINKRTLKLQLSLQEDTRIDLVEALRDEFNLKSIHVNDFIMPNHGIVDGLKLGSLTDEIVFIPSQDYNGLDKMALTLLVDGILFLDIAIEFNIQSVNDAPIAVDDYLELPGIQKDYLISIDDAPGFLDDTDVDGDYFAITDFSLPKHGTLTAIDALTFSYSPNPGFTGIDQFSYVISDGEASDMAAVQIILSGATN